MVASAVLSGGCGRFSPDAPPGPTGTLTGTLEAVAGRAGVAPRGLSGQVALHMVHGSRRSIVTVGANGRFSVPESVGTYTVSGHSPGYEGGRAVCRASGPVVVAKGVTSYVRVDCLET